MKNHLIIGLGGTGGKIIRALKKSIYQEFRADAPIGLQMAYLYIDSSGEMMDLNDPSWKVLGHSVQLGQNSQLKITGANLRDILDNIQNFPGIRPWIGDRDKWKDILNSIVGEALGGQKRRLGRFLFANRVDDFSGRIRHLVSELEHASGTTAVTFHIVCGLAGGTGSGSIIDVVSQIRRLGFNHNDTYRIILYTLLPDANPPANWDTGNYHANGYAALSELNALSVGRFNPHDISGKKDRLDLLTPFNGCYVFTNRNENGMTVDVDKVMPEVVADFLYQKIITVRDVDTWPATLRKMENAENGDGSAETAPQSNIPERSKRFLTFGIKRLAVPEEEIREYLTYNFTSQAALQLLYNNWQDGTGFVDEPKNVDFKEAVQQAELQTKWKLKDDHLCLSVGILSADAANRKWKPINQEWQDFVTNSKLVIRDQVDRKRWPDELTRMCEKRYSEGYRSLGVAGFYDTKLRAKQEMAKEISRLVEADLFDEWRTGAKSMHEVSRMLEDLISVTDQRKKDVKAKKAKIDKREESAEEQAKHRRTEWAGVGIVGLITGKYDKIFDALAAQLLDLYVCRTWSMGWDFGEKLLEEINNALQDLKREVDECFSRVRQANDKFRTGIDSRCNDDGGFSLKQHLIRFYDPELVKTISSRFVGDEKVQSSQTGGVRALMVNQLGEQPGFRTFNKKFSLVRLMDTLEAECEKSVIRTHEVAIESAREKLLGVNIVERLKNQYAGNLQELRSFIADLVKFAGNYVHFSDMEKNRKGEGIKAAETCVTEFVAIIPRAPEHSEFVGTLKQIITDSSPGKVSLIETDARPNEITLIRITNLFPLRLLEPLGNLKEKFEQRITDLGRERATLELHLEGDGSALPPLFVEKVGTIVESSIPYLLIAKAMGIIAERENQNTGVKVLSILTKDDDGFDNDPIDLAGTLTAVPDNLEPSAIYLLKDEVGRKLQEKEYLHIEKRSELIRNLQGEIEGIKTQFGIDDERYKRFLKGAKDAANILKAEAN